jgi:hypothetical protein
VEFVTNNLELGLGRGGQFWMWDPHGRDRALSVHAATKERALGPHTPETQLWNVWDEWADGSEGKTGWLGPKPGRRFFLFFIFVFLLFFFISNSNLVLNLSTS